MVKITPTLANEMTLRFISDVLPEIDTVLGTENTDFIDFPFNQVQNYFLQVQREMRATGLTPLNFRLYLGVYPGRQEPENLADKLTIIGSVTHLTDGVETDYLYGVANMGNLGMPPKAFPDLAFREI
jgi:hypothetical protein